MKELYTANLTHMFKLMYKKTITRHSLNLIMKSTKIFWQFFKYLIRTTTEKENSTENKIESETNSTTIELKSVFFYYYFITSYVFR